jgi:hypothetical protein
MSPMAPLRSPEIIKSFSVMAFLLKPSLDKSLSKLYKFWDSFLFPIDFSPHSFTA